MLDDDERMSAAVIVKRNGVKRYEVRRPIFFQFTPLTHARETFTWNLLYKSTYTRNLHVWHAAFLRKFFSYVSFLHRIERSCILRKFIQELAWTCVKIWRKTLVHIHISWLCFRSIRHITGPLFHWLLTFSRFSLEAPLYGHTTRNAITRCITVPL